jgi:uncharacterized protein (TIGR03435 family)
MLQVSYYSNDLVIDKTGLDGLYDFKIEFASSKVGAVDTGLPGLATVLEQDLGLKLERAKTIIDVLVIESANREPTEN